MPEKTNENAMIEFFNWDGEVDVINVTNMAEFTTNNHLIQAEGITPGVIKAALDAHEWILSDGNQIQRS